MTDQSTSKPRRKQVQKDLEELRQSILTDGNDPWDHFDFPFVKKMDDLTTLATIEPERGLFDSFKMDFLSQFGQSALAHFSKQLIDKKEQKVDQILSHNFQKSFKNRKAFMDFLGIEPEVETDWSNLVLKVVRNDLMVLAVSKSSMAKADFRDGYLTSVEDLEGQPVTVVKQRRMPEGSKVTLMSVHRLVSEPLEVSVRLMAVPGREESTWEKTYSGKRSVCVDVGVLIAEFDYLKFRKTEGFMDKLRKGSEDFENQAQLLDLDQWLNAHHKITGK